MRRRSTARWRIFASSADRFRFFGAADAVEAELDEEAFLRFFGCPDRAADTTETATSFAVAPCPTFLLVTVAVALADFESPMGTADA